jgi:hypothetical protein
LTVWNRIPIIISPKQVIGNIRATTLSLRFVIRPIIIAINIFSSGQTAVIVIIRILPICFVGSVGILPGDI